MTTLHKARIDARSEWLRSLPEVIERQEALGHPVIVALEVPVDEHVQRLLATFGVLVRFIDPKGE